MRFFRDHRGGFAVLELIIALSIVGLLLSLTWGTVQFLLSQKRSQILNVRAHFLAVEALELVRSLRDSAILNDRENGFFNAIGQKNGDYILARNNDTWTLVPGPFETIVADDYPAGTFCRVLHFFPISDSIKEVAAEVRWSPSHHCKSVKNSIYYSTLFSSFYL
ncbi:type II secretion system protein [Candidatus Peregrinibacteria bacterium]|nr:MAG: type II secretion system protein [Candidatus Peregrinibacteria bacterium]